MKHGKDIEKRMRAAGDFCNESFAEMHNVSTVEELCRKYFSFINVCITKDFPELDFFRKYIGQSEIYGIYTDHLGSLSYGKNIALLGSCDANIEISSNQIARIWVKHSSKLSITAKDNALIYIDCFDDTEVAAKATGNAKISINQYGKSKVSGTGNVPITQTMKDTYSNEG